MLVSITTAAAAAVAGREPAAALIEDFRRIDARLRD
jgi:hypothetical protein